MRVSQPTASNCVLESSDIIEDHYSSSHATSLIKQARRIVNKRSSKAPPFVVSPPPPVVEEEESTPRRIGKHNNNSCYFSSDSSDYSISAAMMNVGTTPSSNTGSQKEGSSSSAHVVEPEVFLRNPRTGGFDYTPAQREYQQHANQTNGRYDTNKRDISSHRHNNKSSTSRRTLGDLLEGHESNRNNNNYSDTDTLNDSDVYTTFSKPVPAVIKSKSPQKKASTKTTKHLFSSMRGSKSGKQSKLKSIGSVVQQLKCRVTGSPPRTIETPAGFVVSEKGEIFDDVAHETQIAASNDHQQQQPHRTAPDPVLVTPPRSGKSPGKRSRCNNDRDLSGISSLEFSLMDQDRHEEDDDEAEELEYIPEENDDSVESSSESVSAPSFVQNSDIVSLAEPTPLNPSCPSDSSCLDLSFGTAMGKQNKVNDSVWTFQAVSPVLASCGRDTTANSSYHYTYNKNDSDSDSESEDSVIKPLRRRLLHQDSGFDADIEKTREDDETATLDFSIMNPESLSFHSGGAILLTEEGLKRHNDKKLQQPTVEPLALRQPNGVGKLEKVVLHQKVQRLQDKELKNQADASLDEEVAARKRRLKKKPTVNGKSIPQNLDQDDPAGISQVSVTPEKAPRPAMSPTSMSPQTSVGAVASPSSFEKDVFPKKSWFKRMVSKHKNKKAAKNNTEELKEQWREKERKRVELARLEKEEEERFEQERIQALRQSFLEKQRQLEAAATLERQGKAKIVDVDELIAANSSMDANEEHSYNDNTLSSTSNSTDPSSTTGSRCNGFSDKASHRISTLC